MKRRMAERLIMLLSTHLNRDDLDELSLDRLEHLMAMMDSWRPLIAFRIQRAKEKAARAAEATA